MSGLDEVHFKGARALPLRLWGVLRGARSGEEEPLVEEDHQLDYCKAKECVYDWVV